MTLDAKCWGGDTHHLPILGKWREGHNGHFKVEVLKAKASGLRRDLIVAMDNSNSSKEKIKTLIEELNAEKQLVKQKDEQLAASSKKMKNVVAKVVHAFQLTEECNAILFG